MFIFGFVLVAALICVAFVVFSNSYQTKKNRKLVTSISKFLEIGPKEYRISPQEIYGVSPQEPFDLSWDEYFAIRPYDFYDLNPLEMSQAEQAIKDIIRSSNKVVWRLNDSVESDTTITNIVSLDEMSRSFSFVTDVPVRISPCTLIMDPPYASMIFYPSGIKFDFRFDYYIIGNPDWAVLIMTEEYNSQRLEGKVSQEFIGLACPIPLTDSK